VNPDILQALGRTRLMGELLDEGLNVALPVGDSGIDMIAYLDVSAPSCQVASIPIKIKSLRPAWSSRDIESVRAQGLLIVLEQARTFALTPAELTYIKMIGIIERAKANPSERSRSDSGGYGATVRQALEPFAMSRGQWRKKIYDMLKASSTSRRV